MIVPLVGFFIACAIFACMGATVLALIPHLRPTLANIGSFVIGAVPSSAAAAIGYGRLLGDGTGELHSAGAVFGLFGVMLIAGLCGGLLIILAYKWLMRTLRLPRGAGTSASR